MKGKSSLVKFTWVREGGRGGGRGGDAFYHQNKGEREREMFQVKPPSVKCTAIYSFTSLTLSHSASNILWRVSVMRSEGIEKRRPKREGEGERKSRKVSWMTEQTKLWLTPEFAMCPRVSPSPAALACFSFLSPFNWRSKRCFSLFLCLFISKRRASARQRVKRRGKETQRQRCEKEEETKLVSELKWDLRGRGNFSVSSVAISVKSLLMMGSVKVHWASVKIE